MAHTQAHVMEPSYAAYKIPTCLHTSLPMSLCNSLDQHLFYGSKLLNRDQTWTVDITCADPITMEKEMKQSCILPVGHPVLSLLAVDSCHPLLLTMLYLHFSQHIAYLLCTNAPYLSLMLSSSKQLMVVIPYPRLFSTYYVVRLYHLCTVLPLYLTVTRVIPMSSTTLHLHRKLLMVSSNHMHMMHTYALSTTACLPVHSPLMHTHRPSLSLMLWTDGHPDL